MAGEGKQFSSEYQPENNRSGGRKAKKDLYAGQIRVVEDRIAEGLLEYLEALDKLARGEATEEVINVKTGEKVTRRLAPDRQAAEYLINRILGKPVSVKELDVNVESKHTSVTFSMGANLVAPVPPIPAAAPAPALPAGPQPSGLPVRATRADEADDKVIDIAARRKAA